MADGGGDAAKLIKLEDWQVTDQVHGLMEFPGLIKKLVDTPQCQRLRVIKQLGGSYYVYPAADHSRFVHSLGVAYLALQKVQRLRYKSPPYGELITDVDVLCVCIAGLIHDLGHGPFSHLWENFLQKQRPEEKWAHEDQSFLMFMTLIEENDLWPFFEAEGFTDRDMTFIKELIHPPKPIGDAYPFKGRDPGKEYLYQIVSNPFSGVDVDKMDYIARDAKALAVDVSFDFRRYKKLIAILEMQDEFWTVGTGKEQRKVKKMFIGIREKEAMNMVSLFTTRQALHRKAYQHKTTKIIELEILKILALVDDEEIYPVYSPALDEDLRLSTAHRQTDAYITLNNDILGRIQTTRPRKGLSPEKVARLKKAHDLIAKLEKREFPKMVHAINFNPTLYHEWLKLDNGTSEEWKNDLINHHDSFSGIVLQSSDVEFIVTTFDYGAKGNDPIPKVPFFLKDGTVVRRTMKELSHMLPTDIGEQKIFVYACDPNMHEVVRRAAQKWEEKKKREWATPKRPRSEDFSALDVGTSNLAIESLLSPLSPVPSIDDGEDAMADDDEGPLQQTQPQSSVFDRPETPPLSQEKAPSKAEEESLKKAEGSSRAVGPRRNLFPFCLDDEGSS